MAWPARRPCHFTSVQCLRTLRDPTSAPPRQPDPRVLRRRPGQRPCHRSHRRCRSDLLPVVHHLSAALHARPWRHRDASRFACQRAHGLAIRQHAPRRLLRRSVRSQTRAGHRRHLLLGHPDVPLRHRTQPMVFCDRAHHQRLRVSRRTQLRVSVRGGCTRGTARQRSTTCSSSSLCCGSVRARRRDHGRRMEHRAGGPCHHDSST